VIYILIGKGALWKVNYREQEKQQPTQRSLQHSSADTVARKTVIAEAVKNSRVLGQILVLLLDRLDGIIGQFRWV
jgi:hypothetical protein